MLFHMVEIRIAYQGQLHCSAVHGPSGSMLATDAPVDNMGKGQSFSPTDLVATALGTCILTIMGIAAQKRGLELAGATVTVQKEMVSEPVRRIGRLAVDITVPTKMSVEDRQLLEKSAQTCPVKKSLHSDIDVSIMFHWMS
jgi:putative redox protein